MIPVFTETQADARYLRPDVDATPITGDAGGRTIATTDTTEVHRYLTTGAVTTPLTVTGDGPLQLLVTQTTGAVTLPSGDLIGPNALPSGAATFLLVSPPVLTDRVWMVVELTAIP